MRAEQQVRVRPGRRADRLRRRPGTAPSPPPPGRRRSRARCTCPIDREAANGTRSQRANSVVRGTARTPASTTDARPTRRVGHRRAPPAAGSVSALAGSGSGNRPDVHRSWPSARPSSAAPFARRVSVSCDELLAEHDPKTEPAEEFLGAQFDLGLALVHFPEGHGGLGLSPRLQTASTAHRASRWRRVRTHATRSVTAWARPRSSRTAPTNRSSGTCGRCSPAKRSGASCSASRAPAPTSPASRRVRSRRRRVDRQRAEGVDDRSRTFARAASLVARTNPDTRSTRASRTSSST